MVQQLKLTNPVTCNSDSSLMPTVREISPEPLKGKQPAFSNATSSKVTKLLRKTQKFSAYGFMVFISLHLSAVVFAPIVSPDLGNKAMLAARSIYQSYFGEWIFVYASVILHVLSGVILHVWHIAKQRHGGGKLVYFTNSMQKTGLVLNFLVLGHFLAMRGGALLYLDGDSSVIDLNYVRWSMAQGLAGTVSVLILVAIYAHHAVSGSNLWFRLRLPSTTRNGIVAGVTFLALISLIRIGKLPLPTDWRVEYYKKAHAIVG